MTNSQAWRNVDWDRLEGLAGEYVAISRSNGVTDVDGFVSSDRSVRQVALVNHFVTGCYPYLLKHAEGIRQYNVVMKKGGIRIPMTLADMQYLFSVDDLVGYAAEGVIRNMHKFRSEGQVVGFVRSYATREMFERGLKDSRMVGIGVRQLIDIRTAMFRARDDHQVALDRVSMIEEKNRTVPSSLSARAVTFTLKSNYDVIDVFRGEGRERKLPWVQVLDSGSYVDDEVIQRGAVEAFRAAFSELGWKQKCFVWGLYEGMSTLVIGEHLGFRRSRGQQVAAKACTELGVKLKEKGFSIDDFV
jgi:hypothetical protein